LGLSELDQIVIDIIDTLAPRLGLPAASITTESA
jgi:hypothetical protein